MTQEIVVLYDRQEAKRVRAFCAHLERYIDPCALQFYPVNSNANAKKAATGVAARHPGAVIAFLIGRFERPHNATAILKELAHTSHGVVSSVAAWITIRENKSAKCCFVATISTKDGEFSSPTIPPMGQLFLGGSVYCNETGEKIVFNDQPLQEIARRLGEEQLHGQQPLIRDSG